MYFCFTDAYWLYTITALYNHNDLYVLVGDYLQRVVLYIFFMLFEGVQMKTSPFLANSWYI